MSSIRPFLRIQNLETILENLCITERTSQKLCNMEKGVSRHHYSMNTLLILDIWSWKVIMNWNSATIESQAVLLHNIVAMHFIVMQFHVFSWAADLKPVQENCIRSWTLRFIVFFINLTLEFFWNSSWADKCAKCACQICLFCQILSKLKIP